MLNKLSHKIVYYLVVSILIFSGLNFIISKTLKLNSIKEYKSNVTFFLLDYKLNNTTIFAKTLFEIAENENLEFKIVDGFFVLTSENKTTGNLETDIIKNNKLKKKILHITEKIRTNYINSIIEEKYLRMSIMMGMIGYFKYNNLINVTLANISEKLKCDEMLILPADYYYYLGTQEEINKYKEDRTKFSAEEIESCIILKEIYVLKNIKEKDNMTKTLYSTILNNNLDLNYEKNLLIPNNAFKYIILAFISLVTSQILLIFLEIVKTNFLQISKKRPGKG